MELRKCPRCGEMYSTSYRRCPFCEELDKPHRSGRRTAEKKYTPGVRGPLIVILLLVLALLTFCFFGDDLAERFFGAQTPPQEDVQPPVQQPEADDPIAEDPGVDEPPVDEPPVEEPQPPVVEEPDEPDISGAKLNRTDFTMTVGETFQMVFTPAVEGVVWKSSDATVASVSESGLVTGITGGNTTITATVGDVTLKCIVRVSGGSSGSGNVNVSNARLSSTDFTLNVGETTRLRVSGTDASVSWSVGNNSIASISSNGTVKALKSGMTTAYAKVGNKTLECIVRVR